MSTRSHLRQLETAVIVYCWVQVQNDKKNFDIKLLFFIIKYTLRNKLTFLVLYCKTKTANGKPICS